MSLNLPLTILQLKILTSLAYKAWLKLVSSPASCQDVTHSHLQMETKVPSSSLLTVLCHARILSVGRLP
nr:hypothetical protein Iba_scaffold43988CG0010 [Ipomoea batatas]